MIVIDATAGGASANSFVDLNKAKAMAASAGMSAFLAKSNDEISAALIRAALDLNAHTFHHSTPWNIDVLYGATWVAWIPDTANIQFVDDLDPQIYRSNQALTFPRRKDKGLVPATVQWGQLYQAEFIAISGEVDRAQWSQSAPGKGKQHPKSASPLCPRALAMVAKLISTIGAYSGG